MRIHADDGPAQDVVLQCDSLSSPTGEVRWLALGARAEAVVREVVAAAQRDGPTRVHAPDARRCGDAPPEQGPEPEHGPERGDRSHAGALRGGQGSAVTWIVSAS